MHYIFPDLIAAGVEGVAVVPVYFLRQRFSNLSTSVSWLRPPAALQRGCSCLAVPAESRGTAGRPCLCSSHSVSDAFPTQVLLLLASQMGRGKEKKKKKGKRFLLLKSALCFPFLHGKREIFQLAFHALHRLTGGLATGGGCNRRIPSSKIALLGFN